MDLHGSNASTAIRIELSRADAFGTMTVDLYRGLIKTHLGKVKLFPDGWYVVGAQETQGMNPYSSQMTAIEVILDAGVKRMRDEIARGLGLDRDHLRVDCVGATADRHTLPPNSKKADRPSQP